MVINFLSNQATSGGSVPRTAALRPIPDGDCGLRRVVAQYAVVPLRQEMPAIAVTAGGSIAVWASVVQDGSDWGVFGQRLNASGQKIGPEFQVTQTTRDAQRRRRSTPGPMGGLS